MLLIDETTMGLAHQLVAEIFNIVKELNQKEGVSILLAEQNTNIALKNSDYGYIIETGKVMLEGSAESLLNNDKVNANNALQNWQLQYNNFISEQLETKNKQEIEKTKISAAEKSIDLLSKRLKIL